MTHLNFLKINNISKTLDSIHVITSYPQYIKKQDFPITDPAHLSLAISRRFLKQQLPNFEIRKNKYDYSLKLKNSEFSEIILITKRMFENKSFLKTLDKVISDELNSSLGPLNVFLQEIRDSHGIHFAIKNDSRFFLYFQNDLRINFTDLRDFSLYSTKARMEKLRDSVLKLFEIKYSSCIENLIKIIKENSIYDIYKIKDLLITEDFINYYMSLEESNRYGRFSFIWESYNKNKKNLESPTIQTLEFSPNWKPCNEKKEESEPTIIPTLRIRPIQSSPVLESSTGIRLFLEEPENSLPSIFQDLAMTTEEEFDPLFGDVISQESLSLYLKSIDISDKILKTTDIDLFDDIDEDKEGAYYKLINNQIEYYIFLDNIIKFKGSDFYEVKLKYIEIFNQELETLKFFVDDFNECNILDLNQPIIFENIPF